VRPGDVLACPDCSTTDLIQQISTFAVSSSTSRAASLAAARRKNMIATRDRDMSVNEQSKKEHADDGD
jgi:hypothetical protein